LRVWQACQRKPVEKNLIKSLEIRDKKVKVNKLQYVDDTLFFCETNTNSVFNLKVILNCFELASGLKVNFLNSKIGGVGVVQSLVQRFAAIFNCDVMKTLFTYLGLLMGVSKERCVLGRCVRKNQE